MSHIPRKAPWLPEQLAQHDDEGSVIRQRDAEDGAGPRRDSSPELRAPAPSSRRAHSSTRPAVGSLDDRLEKKMRLAGELMRHLPQTDARVRLLYVAVMRRDETLLDGVLAELNKKSQSG